MTVPGSAARVLDIDEMTRLLVGGCRIVESGADDESVLALFVALRDLLDTGTWTDLDRNEHPYRAAGASTVVSGNCTAVNGDLASGLAERGFVMSLTDLARASFENHTVAECDLGGIPVVIDLAGRQFGFEPWPYVALREDYLAETGFRFLFTEPVEPSTSRDDLP